MCNRSHFFSENRSSFMMYKLRIFFTFSQSFLAYIHVLSHLLFVALDIDSARTRIFFLEGHPFVYFISSIYIFISLVFDYVQHWLEFQRKQINFQIFNFWLHWMGETFQLEQSYLILDQLGIINFFMLVF